MKSKDRTGIAPERSGVAADSHYHKQEAERYTITGQAIHIQHELTYRALTLTGLSPPLSTTTTTTPTPCPLLLDIGCGSGLSSKVLTNAGFTAWIGTDIAQAMLILSKRDTACIGKVIQSDMGQALPLRHDIFDAAISISAVQWLCSAQPNPTVAITKFFGALYGTLKSGAVAVLQVYLSDDNEAAMLLQGAFPAGFQGGYYIDFPHPTPAKKYYICLVKPPPLLLQLPLENPSLHQQPPLSSSYILPAAMPEAFKNPLMPRCSCVLAWPKCGSCVLHWLDYTYNNKNKHNNNNNNNPINIETPSTTSTIHTSIQQQHHQEQYELDVTNAKAKLQHEHAQLGKRMLRLLRRAVDDASGQQQHQQQHNVNADTTTINTTSCIEPQTMEEEEQGEDKVLLIEGELVNKALTPCRGAITVHATVQQQHLHHIYTQLIATTTTTSVETKLASGQGHGEADEDAVEGLSEATTLITWLLNSSSTSNDGGGGEGVGVLNCNLKESPQSNVSAPHISLWSDELRAAAAAASAATNPATATPHTEHRHKEPVETSTSTAGAADRTITTQTKKRRTKRTSDNNQQLPKPSKSQFYRIEFLPTVVDTTTNGSKEDKVTANLPNPLGLLFAQKLPPLLIIPLDYTYTHTSNTTTNTSANSQRHPADIIQQLCCCLEMCVVGVDVRFHKENCNSVWLLYRPGIGELNRQDIVQSVRQIL